MNQLKSSAPARLALIVVLGVVVQFITHSSWFAIGLLVTYFAAKEIVVLVLPSGVGGALLAVEPRLRISALVCDNAGFLAALAGYFMLPGASPGDAGTVARFAGFEAAVIVLVTAWGLIAAAAFRRSAGTVQL